VRSSCFPLGSNRPIDHRLLGQVKVEESSAFESGLARLPRRIGTHQARATTPPRVRVKTWAQRVVTKIDLLRHRALLLPDEQQLCHDK
jgi:hypothetical protein